MTRWAMVGLLVLAACAPRPGYVPISEHGFFGYSSEVLAPTRLRIAFTTPRRSAGGDYSPASGPQAGASAQQAFDLALLRAAELAQEQGWRELTVVNRETDVEGRVRYDYYHDPLGFPFGFPYDNRRSFGGRRVLDSRPDSTVQTTVVLEVTLHTGQGGDRGPIDAATTVRETRARYGL